VPSARFSTRPSATYPTNIPGYVPQAAKASRLERYGVPAATAASLGGAVGTAFYGGPLVPWGPDNDAFQALQSSGVQDALNNYGYEKARDLYDWIRNRDDTRQDRQDRRERSDNKKDNKKDNKEEKKRDEAARKIQKAYRSYRARKGKRRAVTFDFNDYERKRRRYN
jgi:hypothetical protein